MRMGSAGKIAMLSALAVSMAGCPSSNSSCPLETPQVNAPLPSCTEPPNQQVNYPIRLCPTCNQTGATCNVQMSGGDIFLDLKVEACADSSSCGGAGCSPGPTVCSFTAPSAPGTYNVTVTDAGGTLSGTLVVSASSPPSCALPTAGL